MRVTFQAQVCPVGLATLQTGTGERGTQAQASVINSPPSDSKGIVVT